jgi:hypothetical protein
MKCANCGGKHKANSKECERIKAAKDREQNKVMLNPIKMTRVMTQEIDTNNNQAVHRHPVLQPRYRNALINKNMATTETQTDIDMQKMKSFDRIDSDFFLNLSHCLADLFPMPLQAESKSKRNNII